MKIKSLKPPSFKSTQLDKKQLNYLLSSTYKPNSQVGVIDNYVPDPTLSDNRVKVFHNKEKKHTVVAHRGSASAGDWMENLLYLRNIKRGPNWTHSKEIQKKAEEKYGVSNLTTIGHSKGALHAQEFGKKGDIVTLNKPVNLVDIFKKVPQNQKDYRGEGDLVSILRPLQRGNKETVLTKGIRPLDRIKKAFKHPINVGLKEHGVETILRNEIY